MIILPDRIQSVRTPEVFQMEACECGAASLSMILRYYGCEMPMEQIRYECGVSRDGCSAADIVSAAGHFGLTSRGYRVSLEGLRKTPLPCILHWNFTHFVVLEKIGKKTARINDPACGHRTILLSELDDSYTGVLLTFAPNESFKKQHQPSGLLKLFTSRIASEKQGMLYIVLSGLLLSVPGVIIPLLTRAFIDTVLLHGTGSYARSIVVCLALLFLFQISFSYLRSYILSRLRLKMSVLTTSRLLQKMIHLPILFFEQRYHGELPLRLETNMEINDFLVGKLTETILNFLQTVIYLILMISFSRLLTLIGLIGTSFTILVSFLLLRPLSELSQKKRQDQGYMSGILSAGISASDTIKASGVENEYSAELLGHYSNLTISEQRLGFTQQIVSAIPGACSNILTVLILVIGTALIIRGHVTAGTLISFSQLFTSFVAPVNQLILFSQSIQEIKASFSRVEDIEAVSPDIRYTNSDNPSDSNAPSVNAKLSGTVEISHLTFGYNPTLPPVISDFSLKAAPGSRIALVGSSGCGKSTVGKLLAGLLQPWSGSVLYDGVPIHEIPVEWLCGSVSVISQNGAFFSGTIRENITMWKQEYPDKMLYKAVVDADANEFISLLPGALDYRLEEGGKNLSGGQRQKLEIARALMSNPSVIIMDEATSAIDAVSESRIMDNIRKRDCTCIMIAHRLSSIRDCDLIFVMNQGRIAECGTHEELIARNGLYYQLVSSS